METINLPDVVRQSDGQSCENFVCVYFYVESILLIKYFTKDDLLVSFKDMVKKHINAERTIMDFKIDLRNFFFIKKKGLCN